MGKSRFSRGCGSVYILYIRPGGIGVRIIHRLYRIIRLENADFIAELYRELAHREAAPREFDHCAGMLSVGVPKVRVIARCLQNPDILRAMEQAGGRSESSGQNTPSAIGDIIGDMLSADDRGYVRSVYRELLLREPDGAGWSAFLSALGRGVSRMRVFVEVLNSEECRNLLQARDLGVLPIPGPQEADGGPPAENFPRGPIRPQVQPQMKQAIISRLQTAAGLR